MTECMSCRAPVTPGTRFCRSCGQPVAVPETPYPSETPTQLAPTVSHPDVTTQAPPAPGWPAAGGTSVFGTVPPLPPRKPPQRGVTFSRGQLVLAGAVVLALAGGVGFALVQQHRDTSARDQPVTTPTAPQTVAAAPPATNPSISPTAGAEQPTASPRVPAPTPTPPAPQVSSSPTTGPSADTVRALNAILTTSLSARALTRATLKGPNGTLSAVQKVKDCHDVDGGLAMLRGSRNGRDDVLTQLETFPTADWPQASQFVTELTSVQENSIRALDHYIAFGEEQQLSCDPQRWQSSPDYTAAGPYDTATSAARTRAAQAWSLLGGAHEGLVTLTDPADL